MFIFRSSAVMVLTAGRAEGFEGTVFTEESDED
jgi:hypothetical protein